MVFLFKIYIGILKKCPPVGCHRLPLIAGVCRGLTKFSFLIDSIYFSDLISSLKPFGEDFVCASKMEVHWDVCHYLVAVFTIASHQKSIQFDLAFYYHLFYKFLRLAFAHVLFDFSLHPCYTPSMGGSSAKGKNRPAPKNIFSEWKPTFTCKDADLFSLTPSQRTLLQATITELFSRQSNLPNSRVASFAQRLVWICMAKIAPETVTFLLDNLSSIGKAYPAIFKMLFSPSSTSSGEVLCINTIGSDFDPILDDPDNCNAVEYSPTPLFSFLSKVRPKFLIR